MQEIPRGRALLRIRVSGRQRRLERTGRIRYRGRIVENPVARSYPLPDRLDWTADGALVTDRRDVPCRRRASLPRRNNSSVNDISDPTMATTTTTESYTRNLRDRFGSCCEYTMFRRERHVLRPRQFRSFTWNSTSWVNRELVFPQIDIWLSRKLIESLFK